MQEGSQSSRSVTFIAEVKTRSPFGWQATHSWDELFEIANTVGDWISIHTDPRWGGSFDLVREARRLTNKPILAKGIHSSDLEVQEAIESGADYVLVVGRIPAIYRDRCLIEPKNHYELLMIPTWLKAVWNSRDLSTGKLKSNEHPLRMFAHARSWPGWLCQASNIESWDDIDSRAQAVLVGTHLPNFLDRPVSG